jgi:phage shock protein A
MTDAALMDAECIHGWVWWDCSTCSAEMSATLEAMSDTHMTIDQIEEAVNAALQDAERELEEALGDKSLIADRVREARAAVEKARRAAKAFRKRGE